MDRIDDGRRRGLRGGLAAAISSILPAWHAGASAQSGEWPQRPIRILVGFPPGGLTDSYARQYGEFVSSRTGQPVTVENRPGGGAMIALEALARSPADGYTIAFTTSGTIWQNRVLYRKLPYDPDKDFAPISLFPSGPLMVGVHAALPIKDVNGLIEYAKTRPTSMGTYAPASYPHMVADVLNRLHGLTIAPVHYKGEAPMWIDVASNQVQVAIGSYSAFAPMQSKGLVRAIAVTGRLRSPKLPDVPTLAEQGIRHEVVGLDGWLPLLAPGATAEPIQVRLAELAAEWAQTPRAAQLRENFAIPNPPTSLDEARRRAREDSAIWIREAKSLGVTLD